MTLMTARAATTETTETTAQPAAPAASPRPRDLYRRFLDGQIPAESLPEPLWGPIGREVYERTYSREAYKRDPDTEDFVRDASGAMVLQDWWGFAAPAGGRTSEVWAETARRVVLGNTAFAPAGTLLDGEALDLFETVFEFGAIPGGRHLWVTGTNIAFSRNCFSAGWSPRTSDHFRFLASRLFEGGGVGANYSRDLMAATAPILGSLDVRVTIRPGHADHDGAKAAADGLWADYGDAQALLAARQAMLDIHEETGAGYGDMGDRAEEYATVTDMRVEDTREGWVEAWCSLIDLATLSGRHTVVVDLSLLRPHGSPLRTFGGRASGPAPLSNSLVGLARVLSKAAGRRLTGIEAMEIDHGFAASIVAGGARRSARMSVMRWDDPEIFPFIRLKRDTAIHWTTNISVEVDARFRAALAAGDGNARDVLVEIARGMARDGEPGMLDTSLGSVGERNPLRTTNPCVTGDSWVQTTSGLRQVDDLAGKGTQALVVNDEVWSTSGSGFFQTGVKPVLRLDIDGTPLRVTADHLVSTPDGWRAAGDLTVGDVVTLTDSDGNSWAGSGTEAEGYLVGHLIGDGTYYRNNTNGQTQAQLCVWDDGHGPAITAEIDRQIAAAGLTHRSDHKGWRPSTSEGKTFFSSAALRDLAARFGVRHGHKTLTPEIMAASSDFIVGFLRGMFDTDGHVEGDPAGGGLSVRLSQADAAMLGSTRTLLLALGIRSVVRKEHPARTVDLPGGPVECQASFRLIISGVHIERFSKIIGFAHPAKQARIASSVSTMSRGFYGKPMVGTVRTITEDGAEAVYDCQVPGLNAFVANGTVVHNCGEIFLETDPSDGAGESCNLGSVNLDHYGTDLAGAAAAFALTARFLYRATLNPYPDAAANRIETRNRRIGVGFMGLQGWAAAHGVRLSRLKDSATLKGYLHLFRQTSRAAADDLADTLSLPRPVKVTTVPPTGSISQMPGVGAGGHAVIARHFIRRVRYADTDPKLAGLAAAGYNIVDDVYAANTKVVEFYAKDSLVGRYGPELIEQADEIGFADFMELVATIQATFCHGTDGNAVSATAALPAAADPEMLAGAIERMLGRVKGITAFPAVSRPLTPIEAISEADYDLAVYSLGLAGDVLGDSQPAQCAGGACPVR